MGTILASLMGDTFDTVDALFAMVFQAISNVLLQNPLDGGIISFSWANTITLYMQVIAFGIVVVLRIVTAVKDGIFRNGGDVSTGESTGQWFFHSLWSLALVCAMPAIIQTLASFSSAMATDITVAASTGSDGGLFSGMIEGIVDNMNTLTTVASVAAPILSIISAIIGIVCIWYVITIVFQILKRQIQLIILSIIAPLVAITSGTSNSSDVGSICKEVVSIGIISGLQLVFLTGTVTLISTISVADAWTSVVGSDLAASTAALLTPLIAIACFAAVKQLPRWVESYVPNTSVGNSGAGGRAAGMAASQVARSAISKAVG